MSDLTKVSTFEERNISFRMKNTETGKESTMMSDLMSDLMNDFSLMFLYDTADKINEHDSLENVLEDYFAWRAHISKIDILPKNVGKLYLDLMDLDTFAKKMMGDLDILILDVLKLDEQDADVRLFNFISSMDINFNNCDTCLILIGFIGYVCSFWGKHNLISEYLHSVMRGFLTHVNLETLENVKKYF
ncbi:hypothetical protein DpV84gp148 [Deerpox virus W-1170-84]|uniref:Toll/IL-receptor-like protein n=1 Tax=Deerpox virus (strain W-1170-84) TaxID=305676 RepID=Q08F33_DPV84|nr:hypothetical protein DpV84gp148 [Deerpox virus W-1170-84]